MSAVFICVCRLIMSTEAAAPPETAFSLINPDYTIPNSAADAIVVMQYRIMPV